jgi:hypothetical protein
MIQRHKRDYQDRLLDTIPFDIKACLPSIHLYHSETCNIQRPCKLHKDFTYFFV